jgi:hypothetical protein
MLKRNELKKYLKSTLQFILLIIVFNFKKPCLNGDRCFSQKKKSGDRCFMVTGVSNTEAKEE